MYSPHKPLHTSLLLPLLLLFFRPVWGQRMGGPDMRPGIQAAPTIISGAVVMEDGSPPPAGCVVGLINHGQLLRATPVTGSGSFSIQINAGSREGWNGCELVVQLNGYRSSSILLNTRMATGNIVHAGTLVLSPVDKIPGILVSVTNLQAGKEAYKAWEKGDKAFRKKRFEEALESFQSALNIYPQYALAWLSAGQCHLELNRLEEARKALAKALEADPLYVQPYIEMARIAAMEKKWDEVVTWTDRALDLDSLDFPECHIMNATAHMNRNDLELAEKSVIKARRLDSSGRFPQAYLILAGIMQAKQDYAGEKQQLLLYLKRVSSGPNAEIVRSRLQELAKMTAKGAHR